MSIVYLAGMPVERFLSVERYRQSHQSASSTRHPSSLNAGGGRAPAKRNGAPVKVR